MGYKSVDELQKVLSDSIFNHTTSAKKASGRALGTIVEIITFYLLKTWGLNKHMSIERGLEEYGNSEINHKVEFLLHPIKKEFQFNLIQLSKNITPNTIIKGLNKSQYYEPKYKKTTNHLLKNGVLRNACTIAESKSNDSFLLASIDKITKKSYRLDVYEQYKKSFAVFECKRVGVEEGQGKGPQTIEKAKQGAYVAKSTSSLQKIRTEDGEMYGLIYKSDGTHLLKKYDELLSEIISSEDKELLRRFILTIGVVSNHGNWFTKDNMNKEMKVLAQSYDWLIFLSDDGLCEFISELLLDPKGDYKIVKEIFELSYAQKKKENQFTKVKMNLDADKQLLKYFNQNLKKIEGWFNVITPSTGDLSKLKGDLELLKIKDWGNHLS